MATIGERLLHEREARNRTLAQLSEATGIGVAYLEAMERNDFNALPGRAFGKLYVRAYAEALGFDPQPLIDDYDREQRLVPPDGRPSLWRPEPPAEREEPPTESVMAPSSKRRVVALSLIGAVAIAAAAYFVLRNPDEEPKPAAPPIEPIAVPPPTLPPPSPPPAAQPSPVPATPEATGRLRVTESGVGRRVVRTRLEGIADRFAPGEVAWFQTRVLGGRGGETVRHVWIFEGRPQQTVTLRLGGPDWRTHSNKTLYKEGSWTVEARDEAGRVLASAALTCGSGGR
jgi:transcriptional regulator with XRE-family HTH domain